VSFIAATRTDTFDVGALERSLRAANRDVGRELAKVARKAQLDAAKAARGSLTLSGMGVRLGVRARTFAGASTVTVEVAARPPGPWSIVESGASAHTVRARRARALRTPYGPRVSAEPKRQTGRRVWTRATEAAAPVIDRAVDAVFDDALTE